VIAQGADTLRDGPVEATYPRDVGFFD